MKLTETQIALLGILEQRGPENGLAMIGLCEQAGIDRTSFTAIRGLVIFGLVKEYKRPLTSEGPSVGVELRLIDLSPILYSITQAGMAHYAELQKRSDSTSPEE